MLVQGNFGKPRPGMVMQSSPLDEHATVTVLPVTSTLVDTPMLRVTVQPGLKNGLQKPFQVMVGKAMALRRNKVGLAFGCVVADAMVEVERCFAVFLGFVKKSVAASGFAYASCLTGGLQG